MYTDWGPGDRLLFMGVEMTLTGIDENGYACAVDRNGRKWMILCLPAYGPIRKNDQDILTHEGDDQC